MPLDREFLDHLQAIMTEVFTGLAETEAKYKAELLWKARKTNNAGAMPGAYKDAEIHALRSRFEQTTERWFQALVQWGGIIDATVERQMLERIKMLGVGPSAIHFPPTMHVSRVQPIQSEYVREKARVENQLNRSAANRLKDLKMKSKQVPQATYINNFNAPVGAAYINSVHNETSSLEIGLPMLQDIDSISAGHPELEQAAREIRAAYPQKASMLEKAQKWVALVASIGGLTEKAIQHGPQIEALIHRYISS